MDYTQFYNQIIQALECNEPAVALQMCQLLEQNNIKTGNGYWLKGHAMAKLGHPSESCTAYRQAWALGCRQNMFEFRAKENSFRIKDTPHSESILQVMEEMYQDQYGLSQIPLPEKPTIIDVGAHVGLFSILASQQYPDARIIAFEPLAATYEALKQNVEFNQLSKVEIHHMGISGNDDVLDFFYHAQESASTSAYFASDMQELTDFGLKAEKLNVTSLDHVFEQFKVEHCDLLKLDCEGAEFDILRHSKCLDKVSRIVIEVHRSEHWALSSKQDFKKHLLGLIDLEEDQKPDISVCSVMTQAV
ncbi:hypothetical protein MTBPR1_80134 [Candidatus Terasakiella magnetica]|uniref:Methyltransferase FkbM domain-containing protein n=1 Tax=Candidatus Terasakiella magnetica TaxID=1867952 RepID=A0A1C3RL91_9PROT|nr:FkbM family methyltransferase [Candidatus Terasakiella magnetica]SCA58080.1 hypothetical protein MTBPR1_80134 [Candidatus Terasakiella magnetica]